MKKVLIVFGSMFILMSCSNSGDNNTGTSPASSDGSRDSLGSANSAGTSSDSATSVLPPNAPQSSPSGRMETADSSRMQSNSKDTVTTGKNAQRKNSDTSRQRR